MPAATAADRSAPQNETLRRHVAVGDEQVDT